MASSYQKLTAEQVRARYHQRFLADDLQPPRIVDALDADGLIHSSKRDAPLKVHIPLWDGRPPFPGADPNVLRMEWRPSSSEQWLDEVATWTLGVDDIAKPLELVFQGEVLRDRKNGRRYATYRVFDRAGNESVLSSRETVDVDIQPPPLRKHPTVKEAQNGVGTGVLDPQYYGVSGVTVVVPLQDDSSPGDKLEVYWKGYGDLGSYHASSPDPSNALQFHIPAKAIPANIGDNRIVEIWYTVAYSDNEPEKSDPLKLTVKPIAEAKFRLIDCPLAARGTPLKLKMSAVPAAGTALTLAAWVYQANTQLINIWLTDANNRREDIRTAWPVTIGTNRATLPKTFLTGVPINSTFSVHVSVSFDGGDTYLSFPRQEIQLLGHRPNKGLRIIIADDHPVVLTGIEMVLSSFADFTCSVVARAENADELIHHLHHTPCDLVISDYAMPYGRLPDGLALMGYLKRRFASLPVIVITMLRNPALLQALLNIGVDSLFDKRSALSELKRAVLRDFP